MSIRPTELKESVYQSEESDMTESELKTEELKKNYLFIIIFIIIDYLLIVFIILHESHIFDSNTENNYLFLGVNAGCLTLFLLFVIIALRLYKVLLSKIIKYLYIVILGAYFIFLLVLKIIYFVNNFDSIELIDIMFLILLLLTVLPKCFFFCYIDAFIITLIQKFEFQKEEAHEDFKQDLENKMERGDNTNWSKTSLPNQPRGSN